MDLDLDTLPRPRERHGLVGHDAADGAVAAAIASGRLHHAWLIGGIAGIGKATFAYRIARHLLSQSDERRGPGLDVDPASRTARLVAAGAHPNLSVLDLEAAAADVDKPPARTVSVRTARRALAFFGSTAANGGHRVCIVDSVEDLTPQAANALLKTIEEPPAKSTLLLVSHAPQRVLPTIRSRCRKLGLSPLSAGEVANILGSLAGDAGNEALRLAAERADGSVRRALTLLDPKRMAIVDEMTSLLDGLPAASTTRVLALADKLGDRRREGDFELTLDTLRRWASDLIRARAALGPARLAPLAELCEKVEEAARDVETYNLDRRPFVLSMFGDLAEAVRHAA